MNVLRILLGRRQRQDGDLLGHQHDQPPMKRIKIDLEKDEEARNKFFWNDKLLKNMTDYLGYQDELQLAACNTELYSFYYLRAHETFFSIYKEIDPKQKQSFVGRTAQRSMEIMPAGEVVFPSSVGYWQSMWRWLRGHPHQTLTKIRLLCACAYTVPADIQNVFPLGPSCSHGDRLYCLASAGAIVTFDPEPKPVDVELTRESDPNDFSIRGYSTICDKLWYCATNNSDNRNSKGYLVLKHEPRILAIRPNLDVRIMDLSKTNQDVGRGDSRTGIDYRPLRPSGIFYTNVDGNERAKNAEVVVSQANGLIFYVGGFDQTISIESYDMTGKKVASTRKAAEGGQLLQPLTKSVVTEDQLIVLVFSETPGSMNHGIYVFGWRDLSYRGYTSLSETIRVPVTGELQVEKMSKDWLVYYFTGQDQENPNLFALRITGGRVSVPPTTIRLGNYLGNAVLLAGDHLYVQSMEGGDIELVQFDLVSGDTIRTLRTGIPWRFRDDGSAFLPLAGPPVEGEQRMLSRTIAGAHVVGNRLGLLITSQGWAKNTIVAFALPPSP